MNFSNETLTLLLNGERNIDIDIKTEKMLESVIDNLFAVYKKYMLWSYDEFKNAIDFLEQEFERRQTYLNTTHEGIFERMKQHVDKMSFGEKLVNQALKEEGYTFKQECNIGHSGKDIHSSSIRLDFVVLYNKKLHIIEYNGEQHYKPIKKFGGEIQFEKQQNNDKIKKEFCETYKIPILEIPYTVKDLNDIKTAINRFIKGE